PVAAIRSGVPRRRHPGDGRLSGAAHRARGAKPGSEHQRLQVGGHQLPRPGDTGGLEEPAVPQLHVLGSVPLGGQLLRGERPAIDPEVFRDKIVFVGATGAALSDTFETPFAGSQGFKMPGIQVHAAVADDILSNRFIRPAGTATNVAPVIAAGFLGGIAATILPAWWATGVTLLGV